MDGDLPKEDTARAARRRHIALCILRFAGYVALVIGEIVVVAFAFGWIWLGFESLLVDWFRGALSWILTAIPPLVFFALRRRTGNKAWITLLCTALLFGITVQVVPTSSVDWRGYAFRSTKHFTESIVHDLEWYAEANDGYYPEYLIGGCGQSNPDPLLRASLLPDYFPNFYSIHCATDHWLVNFAARISPSLVYAEVFGREYREHAQKRANDPYRSRFGSYRLGHPDLDLMGNVAADHRTENGQWGLAVWEANWDDPQDEVAWAVAGNFYYKAIYEKGESRPTSYILMGFGAPGHGGQDVLTDVPNEDEMDCRLPDGSGVGACVPVLPERGIQPDGKPDGVIIRFIGGTETKKMWQEYKDLYVRTAGPGEVIEF